MTCSKSTLLPSRVIGELKRLSRYMASNGLRRMGTDSVPMTNVRWAKFVWMCSKCMKRGKSVLSLSTSFWMGLSR